LRTASGEYSANARLAIGDVGLHERDARILQRRLEIQQAARVGQLVDDDDAIGSVVERVLNEVGADETRAAGDEQSAHQKLKTEKRKLKSELEK
jgi:hypothetical protein